MSLKITGLSKRFGNEWVLRNVDFEARRGEVFGVFGAPGSGKSTLIDILSSRTEKSGGSLDFAGRDLSKEQVRVANRPVPPPFWRSLFNRRQVPSTSDISRRIEELDRILEDRSEILLIDSPFGEFDQIRRDQYIDKLRRFASERNAVVVLASGAFDEIMMACDRAGVLIDGELRQLGTPQSIYESPATRAIAAMTGRHNLIEARRLSSSKAEIPEFQTIKGGHRVMTGKAEKAQLGALNQNVTLLIRPENISLSFGASFPEDNLLKATITGVRFIGPHTRILLDAEGLGLEAMVLRLVGLNVGDECMVGLPPDRMLVLSQ